MVAVVQVAIATRRRRAHHRMVVDLVGKSQKWGHDSRAGDGLRILDVAEPLAYCLPGVRSRVVVSEGTLTTLADKEIAAILSHERAHLRARHDLVLEMFTAVHAAFPRFVRSAQRTRCRPAAHRDARRRRRRARRGPHSPGPRPGRLRVRPHPVGRAGRRRPDHGAAACAAWAAAATASSSPLTAYLAAAAVLVVPTVALAVPWLTELHRLFIA